jgi:hypothetical protein
MTLQMFRDARISVNCAEKDAVSFDLVGSGAEQLSNLHQVVTRAVFCVCAVRHW